VEDEIGGECSTNCEERIKVIGGKARGKKTSRRSRRRWVYNIRMDLEEVGSGDVNCNGLAQDSKRWRDLVNSVMNLRVP
jgi:hypothetical protein